MNGKHLIVRRFHFEHGVQDRAGAGGVVVREQKAGERQLRGSMRLPWPRARNRIVQDLRSSFDATGPRIDFGQDDIIGGGFWRTCDRGKEFIHHCFLIPMPGKKRHELHMHVDVVARLLNSLAENLLTLRNSQTFHEQFGKSHAIGG